MDEDLAFILQEKTKRVLECVEKSGLTRDLRAEEADTIEKLQKLEMVNENMELTEKGKKCLEKIRELYNMIAQ